MSKIAELIEFLKDDPNDNFIRYALALEYTKIEEYENAKSIFDILVKEAPHYLPTYYQYGNLLAEIGQPGLAEEIYKKGIEIADSQLKIKTKQELQQALFLLD